MNLLGKSIFMFISLIFCNENLKATDLKILKFSSSKDTIEVNDEFILEWDIEGIKNVYISGLGNVKPKSSKQLKLTSSTTYFLYAESADTLISRSVHVYVKGSKAVVPYPSITDYQTLLSKRIEVKNQKISEVIQGVTELLEKEGFFVNEMFNPVK